MISEQDIPWVMFGTIICGSVYSSVGNRLSWKNDGTFEEVGINRYFETMVFHALDHAKNYFYSTMEVFSKCLVTSLYG